jgi:hypothetical protein
VISGDPRRQFFSLLSAELRCGPLARRRIRKELVHHLDDEVADLCSCGLSMDDAVDVALRRMGDPKAIAAGFRAVQKPGRARRGARALRSPAWIAVGAMSLVTAWAAELPQASGATTPAEPSAPVHHLHRARPLIRRNSLRPRVRGQRSRRPSG